MPLTTYNQLAIHYIAWPIWKIAADCCLCKSQASLLNPAGASIESWTTFGLVQIRWLKMHNHHAVPIGNRGNP